MSARQGVTQQQQHPTWLLPEQSTAPSEARMVQEWRDEMLEMPEPNTLTTPWQLPSVPVVQVVFVPAATARVALVLPVLAQVAAPKRLLQVSSRSAAGVTTAVLPLLPVTEMVAEMGANSDEGTVRTRPEAPHATVPDPAVASTSAQQLAWSVGF
jgi:hypothetical protein